MFIRSMGSPDCKDIKIANRKSILTVPDSPPLLGVLRVWVTFMHYPCSHFYFYINFGDRLYSKEKRQGSPLWCQSKSEYMDRALGGIFYIVGWLTDSDLLFWFECADNNQNVYFNAKLSILPASFYLSRALWDCQDSTFRPGPNVSTTPLRQWGFQQCLPFSWTTLRGKHCWHPIAIMTLRPYQTVLR